MMFSNELEEVQFGFRVNVAGCAHTILVLGVPVTGHCRLLASTTELAHAKPGPSGTFQHPNSQPSSFAFPIYDGETTFLEAPPSLGLYMFCLLIHWFSSIGLCLLCLYMLIENSQSNGSCLARFSARREDAISLQDNTSL